MAETGSTFLSDVGRNALLSKLLTANGAAYNSHVNEYLPKCHPDTRRALLDDIQQWARDPDTKSTFWLNGMAGTGKSTISRTLAEHFDQNGTLAANFFFKKGEADRGRAALFFSTLAHQLVQHRPALLQHIKAAMDEDSSLPQKPLREQFEGLLIKPLSESRSQRTEPGDLVILVDALDECEPDTDIRNIISLLTREKSLKSAGLKILLTSRPDLPLRLGFKASTGTYESLILQDIPPLDIQQDILVYLKDELEVVRKDFNDTVDPDRFLPPDWPGSDKIQAIAKNAFPLFIIAATIIRIINDRGLGDPDDQLRTISLNNPGDNLSTTYLSVLNRLIAGRATRDKHKVCRDFRAVVGPIVLLQTPLSTGSLERLLGIPKRSIAQRLDLLHSVLNIPKDSDHPVRLLHLSFRDFLLDTENSENSDFRINEIETHKQLAFGCLNLLTAKAPLSKDICKLKMPGSLQSDVGDAVQQRYLPPDARYACLYWVHHLCRSGVQIIDNDQIHMFLKAHFLHWLEALSIMGQITESISQINALRSIAKAR